MFRRGDPGFVDFQLTCLRLAFSPGPPAEPENIPSRPATMTTLPPMISPAPRPGQAASDRSNSHPGLALVVSFVPAVIVLLLAFAVRYWLVEPPAIAFYCEATPWQGGCGLRTAILRTFVNAELGWFALILGLIAALAGSLRLGSAALAVGLAGLVLYSYDPAAVGALFGLLAIVRGHADRTASSASMAE